MQFRWRRIQLIKIGKFLPISVLIAGLVLQSQALAIAAVVTSPRNSSYSSVAAFPIIQYQNPESHNSVLENSLLQNTKTEIAQTQKPKSQITKPKPAATPESKASVKVENPAAAGTDNRNSANFSNANLPKECAQVLSNLNFAELGGEISKTAAHIIAIHAFRQQDYRIAVKAILRGIELGSNDPSEIEIGLISALNIGESLWSDCLARKIISLNHNSLLATVTLLSTNQKTGLETREFEKTIEQLDRIQQKEVAIIITPLIKAWLFAEKLQPRAFEEINQLAKYSNITNIVAAQQLALADYLNDGARAKLAINSLIAAKWFSENSNDRNNGAKSGISTAVPINSLRLVGQYFERHSDSDKAIRLYQSYLSDLQFRQISLYQEVIREDLERAKAKKIPPKLTVREAIAMGLMDASLLVQSENKKDPMITPLMQMALRFDPSNPEYMIVLGDQFENDNLDQEALSIFKLVAKFAKKNEKLGERYVEMWRWHARLREALTLSKIKQNEAAIAQLKTLIKENTKSLDALQLLASIYMKNEKYSDAEKIYGTGIAQLPRPSPEAWELVFGLAMAQERQGKIDLAEKNLQQVLEWMPHEPRVLNYLGYLWIERGKNLAKALPMLEEAHRLAPNDGAITDSLGWGWFQVGNYNKAMEILEQAVNLEQFDATVNAHLGDAYWQAGRYNNARVQWQMALTLKPDEKLRQILEDRLAYGMVICNGDQATAKQRSCLEIANPLIIPPSSPSSPPAAKLPQPQASEKSIQLYPSNDHEVPKKRFSMEF